MLQPVMTDGECTLLHSLISDAMSIVVCCHQHPDGDAIGSMLGMANVLTLLGKEPVMVAPDQYPDNLHWMPNIEKVVRYDKRRDFVDIVLHQADLICCVDFNEPSRTDAMTNALLASPARKVVIDHHPAIQWPDGRQPDVAVIRPQASSACEVLFRVVWQMGLFPSLGKHFAGPVYCGMMTDTGAFTYNSTDPDLYFIISQLLSKKIQKDRIYRNVYHNYSVHRLRLVGHVLCNKLVVDTQLHAAYFTLTRDDMRDFHFVKGDAEGLVNMPLQIKGLRLSISLREDTEHDNLVWVSLRSVDDFPCNEMAGRFFNGGGHLNASGGRLSCSIDEAVETARQAFLAYADKLK